ncbi:SDR family NAD(P)-dependent oxidoreductase [Conexibacter sp. DBS9H8]|uniref:SDR family NAD(P)-dependent oxidoreductase n=1 Tax=Conexibacter sp. DBS9H8 TaxID=2937801 RepID=UPI002010B7FC|nr:SDR family NAD(P)-dependent oxidoreductase [Conexibacter sp. DBS9H8]
MSRRVLLLGGTSEIGGAIVAALARRHPGSTAVIVGRDADALEKAAAALVNAGCVSVSVAVGDADALDTHPALLGELFGSGGFDTVVLAVGTLGGQAALATPREEALALLRTNVLGCGSLLEASLQQLRSRGGGTMVVLSSAAAERPRASLAYYGAAKAGLDALAQALGDAARADGVRTLVVRPGFVHTRMTAGLRPAPLATTPEAVAEVAVRAIERGAHTVWAPPALRWVLLVLRCLPRPLWRRMGI